MDQTVAQAPPAESGWTRVVTGPPNLASDLRPGSIIGNRYEILQILGEGGMGAVYRAYDKEVDRVVALKVIRPDLAGNPMILRMFKQELILARQITHRNVIRIYDLGTADGLRFITMELVDGRDLKSIVTEQGKLTPEAAAEIMEQVCEGLDAAHKESVVHRDLKPQNIMIDGQGKVLVMDFGLAHSTDSGGTGGALLGTPDYMSPEQAQKKDVDAKSDLFTVGLILYELLTGIQPFKAGTLAEILLRRITETAPAPAEVDPSIPKALSDIVVKCLAREPADRYQSAAQIVHDLQVWRGVLVPSNTKTWKRVTLAFALAVVALIGFSVTTYLRRPPPPQKTVTMLVADFANQTGEPVLNGTLEPLFSSAMEGAAFINSYNRTQARQIASQVQPGAKSLDASVARLVAVREGVNIVISGAISKSGSGYQVAVQALDAANGNVIAQSDTRSSTKEAILTSISGLARPIRKSLGDTRVSEKLETPETFTAASLDAAHSYSQGQDAQLLGQYDDAIKFYSAAIAADANFGRAYSGLGVVYRNLGQRDEAERHLKLALSKIGQMSERERYRTRGAYYVLEGNFSKAREEYAALVKQFPSDSAGHANLAIAHLFLRNLPAALEEGKRAVEIYPKNVGQRLNLALYSLYAGDFEGAKRQANETLALNPKFDRAVLVQALAETGSGKVEQSLPLFKRMAGLGPRGVSTANLGTADALLYQGRAAQAIEVLQSGIAADLESKNRPGASKKNLALAFAFLLASNPAKALDACDQAVALGDDENIQLAAALLYLQAGRPAKARVLQEKLAQRLETVPQAYSKLIQAEDLARSRKPADAVKVFQEARQLVDTWIGHFLLGRTYLDANAYAEADSEFDACWKRRGEGTDLYFDYAPTTRYLPMVLYYLGRSREGLGSPAAAESFKAFLDIRAGGTPDAQVVDARKRLAGR
ncbi:MAG: protein kinase [Candidatus Solibacter usitatus]|nr:protein kinase [Candidatus Solibacter usitatus]